jgi:hypothetical protein
MPFRAARAALAPAALALALAGPAAAQAPPLALGGDPRVDPDDFRVTLFASGLDSPLPMQALADGSLLVGTAGGIVRLADADQDGVADAPGTTLWAGGAGLVTSLRIAGTLAFAARSQTISCAWARRRRTRSRSRRTSSSASRSPGATSRSRSPCASSSRTSSSSTSTSARRRTPWRRR